MGDVARKGVGIRVGLEGKETVKRDFQDLTNDGNRMFAQWADGSKPAKAANDALGQSAKGAGEGLTDAAGAAGLAGRGLGLMTVASVGATAVLAALTAAVLEAREAMAFADELADTAKSVGVTTDALQEYQYVLRKAGKEESDAAEALEDFRKKFGAARAELSKEALSPFSALGLSAQDLKRFPDYEDALAEVTKRISDLSSEAEQAAIAEKLGLTPMLPALQMGSDAINTLRREAHELGLVMDAELIRRGAEAQEEFDTLSKVIDIQLKSAIIDLAPAITMIIGLVSDLASAFASMVDAWRDLDHRSTRGLRAELDQLSEQRSQYVIAQMMGTRTAGLYGTPLEVGAKAAAMTYGHTGDVNIPVDGAIKDLDARIADLQSRLGEREERSKPSDSGGTGSLIPPAPGRSARARAGPKGLTAEEKAEGLAALQLEHDLALARATGNEQLTDRLETARLITAEAEKYVKFGKDEAEALRLATEYAERLAISREIAEEKKRQDQAFKNSIYDPGSSPNLLEGLPQLVIGPDGKGWSPEQKEAWARSVADATVDGLDYAIRGGDIWEYLKQQFYRSTLEGMSNAITEALAQADFNTAGSDGGGGFWGAALNWVGGLFTGGATGRAAGGSMGQGYHFGEHGRPELGMFSNGYVADHDATMRMLTDAVAQAGQAGGGGGGAQRIELHLTTDLKIPPGYLPDSGMRQLLAEHRAQTVAMVADRVGPLATVQQQQSYQLKG